MELLRPLIGWLYLWIRYRNKNKVKYALHHEFEGSYDVAGAEVVISTALVILIALILILLVIVLGRSIYDSIV